METTRIYLQRSVMAESIGFFRLIDRYTTLPGFLADLTRKFDCTSTDVGRS